MNKSFESKDFYLSSFLVSEGIEINRLTKDDKYTTFIFEDSTKLQELVRKYHSLAAITEPIRYGNAIKSLKTLIHNQQISITKSNNNYEYQKGLN